MNRNIFREFVKVISGNFAGYFVLEIIHTLSVPVIAFIQLIFFYLYYLLLATLFDRIEKGRNRKEKQTAKIGTTKAGEMDTTKNMNNNTLRELIKVGSGYITGCILLEFIHLYPVLFITIIQMVYFYFYYLVLAILFDWIEVKVHARSEKVIALPPTEKIIGLPQLACTKNINENITNNVNKNMNKIKNESIQTTETIQLYAGEIE
jgi:hypothetical protein